MSTDAYDRATVKLVAGLLPGWLDDAEDAELSAERVLDHLADAGLLLPPGGEMHEEWGITSLFPAEPAQRCFTKGQAERLARISDGKVYRRTVDKLPNGSTITTDWTEVPQ